MSNNATITPEQLRTVLIATELGGKPGDSGHFSYARLGSSSSSFGQMQFDVDANPAARTFLTDNGFDAAEIATLREHGKLSAKDQASLDAKLQMVSRDKLDQFTNDQLDVTIGRVGDIMDNVRKQNPAAADAIVKDARLQLGVADYANQFSPRHDNQLAGFLAGRVEHGIQAENPPTREDMQNFIGSTPYGQNKENARGVEGRAEHFNEAMAELKLGPDIKGFGNLGSILKQGAHGEAVNLLQTQLSALGYLDSTVAPDGKFGPKTAKAVEAFQAEHHLAKGSVGPITQGVLQAVLQPLRNDHTGPLPSVSAMSSLPTSFPSLDDPRNAINPYNALYNKLQQRIPDASEQRLLQFTAACHSQGISERNLTEVHFDQKKGVVSFAGSQNFEARTASVDVQRASPSPGQSIQQLQQTEKQQMQIQGSVQTTIAQNNQAQQGPVPGVPAH